METITFNAHALAILMATVEGKALGCPKEEIEEYVKTVRDRYLISAQNIIEAQHGAAKEELDGVTTD